MNNTCTDKCAWYKKYKQGERCPFYVETVWNPNNGDGRPTVVKDCAPKRSVLLQMEAHNQMIGLQAASEQERNKIHNILEVVAAATDQPKLLK